MSKAIGSSRRRTPAARPEQARAVNRMIPVGSENPPARMCRAQPPSASRRRQTRSPTPWFPAGRSRRSAVETSRARTPSDSSGSQRRGASRRQTSSPTCWAVSLAERTAFGRSAERRPPVLSEAPRHPGGVDDAVAVEPVVAAGAFADMGRRHRLERPVGLQDLAGVGERRRRRARGVGGRRSHQ
jgi:hypothetical protein